MTADQLTDVLIALIVTGVAVVVLLVGALIARRERGDIPASGPSGGPSMARPAAGGNSADPAPTATGMASPGIDERPASVAMSPEVSAVPAAFEVAAAPVAAGPEPEVALDEGFAVTSADLEAAARRLHDPRDEETIATFLSAAPRRRDAAATLPAAPAPGIDASSSRASDWPEATAPVGVAGSANPYIDAATGLESRLAWDRVVADENARYVRYRRPVSVVVAEIDGLRRFEAQFGSEATRRILAAVGGAMRLSARRTDHVAHVGEGRFLALLPETDEIQAINYVERIRAECERWLDAGAVALHLSLGWASPSAVGELDTALRASEERMYAERRRTLRTSAGDDVAR